MVKKLFIVHAESVCFQLFTVEAESAEDAIDLVVSGKGSTPEEPRFEAWYKPDDWDVEEDS